MQKNNQVKVSKGLWRYVLRNIKYYLYIDFKNFQKHNFILKNLNESEAVKYKEDFKIYYQPINLTIFKTKQVMFSDGTIIDIDYTNNTLNLKLPENQNYYSLEIIALISRLNFLNKEDGGVIVYKDSPLLLGNTHPRYKELLSYLKRPKKVEKTT